MRRIPPAVASLLETGKFLKEYKYYRLRVFPKDDQSSELSAI